MWVDPRVEKKGRSFNSRSQLDYKRACSPCAIVGALKVLQLVAPSGHRLSAVIAGVPKVLQLGAPIEPRWGTGSGALIPRGTKSTPKIRFLTNLAPARHQTPPSFVF